MLHLWERPPGRDGSESGLIDLGEGAIVRQPRLSRSGGRSHQQLFATQCRAKPEGFSPFRGETETLMVEAPAGLRPTQAVSEPGLQCIRAHRVNQRGLDLKARRQFAQKLFFALVDQQNDFRVGAVALQAV